MRGRLISLGLTGGVALVLLGTAGLALAETKVPGSVKSAVDKLVGRLVGGDVEASQTQARAQIFNELDKALEKDKKGVAIRTPSFWVASITEQYFEGKNRRSATPKKVTTEKMTVSFPKDNSTGEIEIAFWGAAAYSAKVPHPLLLCIVSDGQNLGEYIESNWLVHENIKKGWIVAAVAESDKYPVGKQTLMAAYPLVHMRGRFNIDPNRCYFAGEGAAAESVQKIATTGVPDRIAGIVLIKPTKAVTSKNSSLYSCAVLHEGAEDATAKAYQELDPERNVSIAASETAMNDLAAWLDASPGRALPASYTWETPTTNDGTTMPWTGSLWIESPQKRGDPITIAIAYDRETNSVKIQGENLGEFIVYMNDDLLDLDTPVSIVVNDTLLVTKKFERQVRTLFDIADTFGEYGRVFTSEFRGFAPAPAAPDAGDGGEKKDDAAGGGDQK